MPEKRLSFLLLSPLLTIALGVWILSTALAQTIGTPELTKTIIHKSGLYQAVIPSQLADSVKNNPQLQGLPLDNPKIQQILGSSLDSSKVQAQGDKAVDGIYAWLEGKSAQPQISIDATTDTSALADAAAKYAQSLPTCAPDQSPGANFVSNPLSATCVPAGVTPDMVHSFVASEIAANPALADTPPVTQNDIKLPNGKTIMETFASAPKWYHWAQLLPLISAIVAAGSALLILALLRPLRGFRSVGKHLLSVGITLAAVSWLLAWALNKSSDFFLPKSSNANIAGAINKLTALFDDAYRDHIIHLSIYMAAAGAVLFAAAWLIGLAFRHRSKASSVPAAAKRPVPVSAPADSLAGSSNSSSFTPLGPPPLPSDVSAAKKTTTKRAATKKAAGSKKKPAARKPRTKKSA